jgi:hypothetical protein
MIHPEKAEMLRRAAQEPRSKVPAARLEGKVKVMGPPTRSTEALELDTKECQMSLLSTSSWRSAWPIASRNVSRFLLDWLKTLVLYTLVVSTGTFLFLVSTQIVSYRQQPLPGWRGRVFSWSEVRLYAIWLPVLAYSSLYMGALLFPFTRTLGWLCSPRWVIGLFGSLLAGIAALVAVLAARWWYVDLSQYPVYAGTVWGMIYGAVLLPRIAGPIYSGRRSWKHLAGIAATILAFGVFASYPLWSK